jgi:hypothetical protein
VERQPHVKPADHPPSPVLTLRVGISGHRPKASRLPPQAVDRVRKQLALVFKAIDAALTSLHTENRKFYAAEGPRIRLVSGMAEGADQMAIAARPEGWAIDAILPFPYKDYKKDFEKSAADADRNVEAEFDAALREASAVLELPEIDFPEDRNSGYARLGGFLVRQIDVLVAVWDGKPEEGAGGTAEVVRKALLARIPVVWIATLEDVVPRMIEVVERDGRPVAPPADCTHGALMEAISAIVALPRDVPPAEACESGHGAGPKISERLSAFLQETWPRPTWWASYDLYKRWVERRRLRLLIPVEPLRKRLLEWEPFFADTPPVHALQNHIRQFLLPRYLWADQLAIDLANRYRSAYILAYLFSTVAVFIALLGLFLHELVLKAVLVSSELLIVGTVVMIIVRGRRSRWHQRWLEYRSLAEMLRDARFLAYFGEYGRIQGADDLEPASSAWYLWYLRATIRELGLPNAVLDGTYQRTHLVAVEKHVLDDQLEYHRPNARTLSRMDRRLYRAANGCFVAIILVLAAFLACWLISLGSLVDEAPIFQRLDHALHQSMAPITFLAAFLPALGAAIAGIRDTADFEGFAARSAKTATDLQSLAKDFAVAKRMLSLDETSELLVATAHILTQDLAAWRSIYGRKGLKLPA